MNERHFLWISQCLPNFSAWTTEEPAGPCKPVKSKKNIRAGEVQEVVRSSLFPWEYSWQERKAQDGKYSGINEVLPASDPWLLSSLIYYPKADLLAQHISHPTYPCLRAALPIFSIHRFPLCCWKHMSCQAFHRRAEVGLGDFRWILPIFSYQMACGCGGSSLFFPCDRFGNSL